MSVFNKFAESGLFNPLGSIENKAILTWWRKRIKYYNGFLALLIGLIFLLFFVFRPHLINIFIIALAFIYILFLNTVYVLFALLSLLLNKEHGIEQLSKKLVSSSVLLFSLIIIAEIIIIIHFISKCM